MDNEPDEEKIDWSKTKVKLERLNKKVKKSKPRLTRQNVVENLPEMIDL